MHTAIRKILIIMTKEEKRGIAPLLLIMLIGALIESLSVSLIVPMVSGLVGADSIGGILSILPEALRPDTGSTGGMISLMAGLIIIFILKNLFVLWQTYLQYKFSADIRKRVQKKLMHFYMTRPYSFFEYADSGDILRTISVDSDYFFAMLNHVLRFFTSIAVSLLMMLAVFVIHPGLTVILIISFAGEYLVILCLIKPFLRKQGKKYRKSLGDANSLIIQSMSGIKSIKASMNERYFEDLYAHKTDELVDAVRTERTFQSSPKLFMEASTVSIMLLFFMFRFIAGGDMLQLIPVLSAFVVAAAKILPAVSEASNAVSYAGYYDGSVSRVMDIMQIMENEEFAEEDSYETLPFTKEIQFRDVSFQYSGRDKKVLDGVELSIPINSAIGIVGASGAGKTTLVDILLGLLKPSAGEILLDGKCIRTDSQEWKRMFAYIPQKIFLMSGSIRQNIVFGRSEDQYDRERMQDALEASQLSDFIDTLPDGLDTEVGEAGIRLSGGQIQRIGIARAVYSDAPVLVFDEATSSIDYDTEALLNEAIFGMKDKKTLVIIAHRAETVENCSMIYRLKDGHIVRER